jgi:hypothetical protein
VSKLSIHLPVRELLEQSRKCFVPPCWTTIDFQRPPVVVQGVAHSGFHLRVDIAMSSVQKWSAPRCATQRWERLRFQEHLWAFESSMALKEEALLLLASGYERGFVYVQLFKPVPISRTDCYTPRNFTLTAVTFLVEVFWVVTPCIVVGYQRFRCPCCLHLQGGSMDRWNASYNTIRRHNPEDLDLLHAQSTRVVWKVRGLAAVRRCYASSP